MKRALFGLLITVCVPAHAAGDPGACKSMSRLGAKIMEARQAGVAMSELMDIQPSGSKIAELRKAFIVDAYDSPRYLTPDAQQSAVRDFENDVYLECIKS